MTYHQPHCLGEAVICAAQNARDAAVDQMNWRFERISEEEAVAHIENTNYPEAARRYLDEGMMTCRCDLRTLSLENLNERLASPGVDSSQVMDELSRRTTSSTQ